MTHHHGPHDDWEERATWYVRIADHFEPEYSKATQTMLEAVGATSGTKVLDLACGPGHTTAAATEQGANALGIDTSPAMIEAARERFPEPRFEIADMEDPPNGPWDAILCRMGAHHADPSWVQQAWRVLRPGGRIALAELGDHDPSDHGNGMRGPQHWVALLRSAGFQEITTTTRNLRLGDLAAQLPSEDAEPFGTHFQNRPIHVIAGQKPS